MEKKRNGDKASETRTARRQVQALIVMSHELHLRNVNSYLVFPYSNSARLTGINMLVSINVLRTKCCVSDKYIGRTLIKCMHDSGLYKQILVRYPEYVINIFKFGRFGECGMHYAKSVVYVTISCINKQSPEFQSFGSQVLCLAFVDCLN